MTRRQAPPALSDQIRSAWRSLHWYRAQVAAGRTYFAEQAEDTARELRSLLQLRRVRRVNGAPQALPDPIAPGVLAIMTVRQLWAAYRFGLRMRRMANRSEVKAERELMGAFWRRYIDAYRIAAIKRQAGIDENIPSS